MSRPSLHALLAIGAIASLCCLPSMPVASAPVPFQQRSAIVVFTDSSDQSLVSEFLATAHSLGALPIAAVVPSTAATKEGRGAGFPIAGVLPLWAPLSEGFKAPENNDLDTLEGRYSQTSQRLVALTTRAAVNRPLVAVGDGPMTALANAGITSEIERRVACVFQIPSSGFDAYRPEDPWAAAWLMKNARVLAIQRDNDDGLERFFVSDMRDRFPTDDPFFKALAAKVEPTDGIPLGDLAPYIALLTEEVPLGAERFRFESIDEDGAITTVKDPLGPIFVIQRSHLGSLKERFLNLLDQKATQRQVSHRVLIDTDLTGEIDDMLALGRLLRTPSVRLVGITTTHDRATLDAQPDSARASYHLAANTLLKLGARRAIAEGASGPMQNINNPIDSPAVRLIREQAQAATPADPLKILAMGPLTNVASALAFRPQITDRIELWFAGAQFEEGVWSAPDPNGAGDPVALRLILEHPRLKTRVIPHGPAGTVVLNRNQFRSAIANQGPGWAWVDAYWTEFTHNRRWADSMSSNQQWIGRSVALVEGLLEPRHLSTQSTPRANEGRAITVATEVQSDAMIQAFLQTLSGRR